MLQLLRSRWVISTVAAVVVAAGLFAATRGGAVENALTAPVTRGEFKVIVSVAGELRAKNSVPITPPQNTCMVGACQMKISSIIPEGTLVKQGDIVAELDRSPIVNYTNNTNLAMQKAMAVFDQAQLDTTLNMSKAREDVRAMEVAVEERRIAKEQAAFEAPSVKRQAELDLEKAERALKQGRLDYVTRTEQAKAKMREVGADLQRNRNQLDMINTVSAAFTVKAPTAGMLIYSRDYSGRKRVAGSQIYYGEAALAELPDLTRMLSTTYINEVDVRKIAVGQRVSLTLDSDPTKRLTGSVTGVANVGEERPNSDAKVFEVKIEVAESDTTLRPGMTTGNAIEVLSLKDALSVPLEAVLSEGGVTYVFKQNGGSVAKQEVFTGALNDTHAVIMKGLDEGDVVLLVPPEAHAQMTPSRLEGPRPETSPAGADAPATKTVPASKDAKGAGGKSAAPPPANKRPTAPPSGKQ